MNSIVIVNSERGNNINAVIDTDNLSTIVVPCVGYVTQLCRNGSSRCSCQGNLTAFANSMSRSNQIDSRHCEDIHVNATCCSATRSRLSDFNTIGSSSRNTCSISSRCSTRNFRTIGLPNIGQVIGIVVCNISRQGNFAIFTNKSIRSCDNHLDRGCIVYIDIVGFANSCTTSNVICDLDSENVRVVASFIEFV